MQATLLEPVMPHPMPQGSMIGGEIYDILRNDHRVVMSVIDAIEKTTDAGRRKDMFSYVRTELVMHSKAEEEVFYRPLRQLSQAAEILEQAEEEHHQIEHLLMELQTTSAEKDSWLESLRALRAVLQRHVAKEESELFAAAKSVYSTMEAEDIGMRMIAEKGKLGMENPLTVVSRKVKELME
jgi:hemerythrin superfamily protein